MKYLLQAIITVFIFTNIFWLTINIAVASDLENKETIGEILKMDQDFVPGDNEDIEKILTDLIKEQKAVEKPDSNEQNNISKSFLDNEIAKIIILNKITTKSNVIETKNRDEKYFGNLSIVIEKCFKSTDIYNPASLMLVKIFDNKIDDDKSLIFHRWLVSGNPSISTFEHPVYEIIPMECISSKE